MILRRTVLKALRKKNGDSKEQAAAKLGISLFTLEQWESTRAGVSDRNYPKMLKVYGVTEAESQIIAQEYKDACGQAKIDADPIIGISDRGYNITVGQMAKWLVSGKPMHPTHGTALIEYAEMLIEQYIAAHPPKNDDLI